MSNKRAIVGQPLHRTCHQLAHCQVTDGFGSRWDHCQADAVLLAIELLDPNGYLVAFVDDVGDFANAAGGHLGDVQQAVAADADINKRAVFGELF